MQENKLSGYPSIDKPWLKYYSEEAINAPLPSGTAGNTTVAIVRRTDA